MSVGNIAMDSIDFRNRLISDGCIDGLLSLYSRGKNVMPEQQMKQLVNACTDFLRGK